MLKIQKRILWIILRLFGQYFKKLKPSLIIKDTHSLHLVQDFFISH